MTGLAVSHTSKFRFAAFAAVLLLVSGLVIALFDEARAAEIQIGATNVSKGQTSATFTADIIIPTGEKVPLASVSAVIETNPTGNTVKTENDRPLVAAVQVCDAPIAGCPTPIPFDAVETMGTAITAIQFDNVYLESARAGYSAAERGVAEGGYFTTCTPCDFQDASGYGYLAGPGYGYGGAGYSALRSINDGAFSGYGYTLGTEDLVLRFEITINPNTLAQGKYWFTFLADTGSGTLGTLSSVASSFEVLQGGGGSPPGGGGVLPPGGGGAPITVVATSITPPAGATSAFQATVTATQGQTVIIQTNSDFLGDVTFVPSGDLTNAQITVVHFPAGSPPAGTGPAPPGTTVAGFIQITVSSGGTTHQVTVAVTIPEADAGDPSKAVLLKWDGTAWAPQSRMTLVQNADGSFTATGSSACCSDFLVAFDEQPPTVTLSVPTGTLTGMQTLTATAEDNVEVSKVEFFVGTTKVGEDTTSPYSISLETSDHPNGAQTLRAVATDFVGNTAEDTSTASFDNEGAPSPTDGVPPGKKAGTSPWLIIVIILIVIAIIGAAGYYFYQQQKK